MLAGKKTVCSWLAVICTFELAFLDRVADLLNSLLLVAEQPNERVSELLLLYVVDICVCFSHIARFKLQRFVEEDR